ncbi:MAG: hypothetical protein GX060_09520 [Firmicutes bacterium]|nr:hypothetical protein [Bacillota bacterium]
MQRVRHLIGLPVMTVATGERLASVKSVVIDLVCGYVRALVVHKGSLFRQPQAIAIEQVHSLEEDAILLKEGEKPMLLATLLASMPEAQTDEVLFGRQIMTEDGKVLGSLDDVFFDPSDGRISHYSLSDGLLQSLLQGSAMIPAPTQPIVGEESIVIPATSEPPDQLSMGFEPPDS